VKRALLHHAGGVIFVHTHPSGVAKSSRADELMAPVLKESLALVNMKVLGHFVVAGNVSLSLAERGLIATQSAQMNLSSDRQRFAELAPARRPFWGPSL
jgi:RadC-like JAB domain